MPGFLEHTDVQVGKLIDELEARGIRDNTLVIYIVSDNGASAEGMERQRRGAERPERHSRHDEEHIAVAEQLGGLDAIGGPRWTTCTTPAGPGPATAPSATPS
jgi:arylsulfatase A-like enzyme